jgi:hypothetical protein
MRGEAERERQGRRRAPDARIRDVEERRHQHHGRRKQQEGDALGRRAARAPGAMISASVGSGVLISSEAVAVPGSRETRPQSRGGRARRPDRCGRGPQVEVGRKAKPYPSPTTANATPDDGQRAAELGRRDAVRLRRHDGPSRQIGSGSSAVYFVGSASP